MVAQIDIEMNDILFLSLMTFLIFATSDSLFAYEKHIYFLFLLITLASNAQDNKTSGLNARQFHKYWKVESESPDYKVTFRGDTAEILSPKGLTLWRKEKMSGKVTIEYDACVVVEAEAIA